MKHLLVSAVLTAALLLGAAAMAQPEGSPSPTPTATPSPSPAPEPTGVPVPESTPEPEAKPDPTPRPIEGLEAHETESGLKYYDIKVGEGEQPHSGADVTVHYTGWLTDGTMFDSSVTKGRPFKFRTNRGVIKGWIEGIKTMRPGGIRRLEIPSELGYGERGSPPKIPANSDLVFEVELISIDEQGPEMTSVENIEAKTTDSGLKYWVIKEGTGEQPGESDRIKLSFKAWLEDGTLVAASSDERPFVGPTENLMKGWAEGVRDMKEGGKRRLLIPPDLGYGERGTRGIPPNATLIIETELLEVLKPIKQTSVEGIEPQTTEGGVKYWDIKEGEGPSPEENSRVRVHYTGWLKDGKQFDSSREKDQPFTFSMKGGVIKGWIEGVKTMKVGGVRRLEIPPDMGYGQRGYPPVIPPDSTLIFEIELLGVE